ncbi:hypothetical protein FA13DRAFT_185658 [Coprinellus micaceus]|uniref:Uncharacterized protein n=1 Tax=Coprinellus micaceus TaxID=71717 RepID=A0A4Y7TFY2_COPMI|nr:hypothetical protein FA13DRAFT_185658 [Coprinellus micaceus]
MSAPPIPARVLSAFRLLPPKAGVGLYTGPWNKLLSSVFPPDSPYTVTPREYLSVTATKEQSGLGDIDPEHQPHLSSMQFEVQFESLPILLVLVSASAIVDVDLARRLADEEVRRQVDSLIELCPLPTLRTITAFGHYMCTYTCDTAPESSDRHIQPPLAVVDSENRPADTAPRERWNSDFLTEDGQRAFLDTVSKIREECQKLEMESA